MNNETKKIIRELKDSIKEHKKEKRSISAGMGMTWEEWDIFFEYFDNLQERIEKAINKVQYIIDIGFDYDGYSDVDNLKILVDELVDLARQTKNILNGRSDK